MTKWILLLVIALNTLVVDVTAETIRLTNGEWPPFTSEKELHYHGVISRIVTEAFALEGITVEYDFFPWQRALLLAKTGDFDGSVAWAQGRADLTPDFLFSDATITIPKAIFSLKAKPVIWKTMEDLRSKTIGITSGYFYGEDFENAKKSKLFTVEVVTNDLQNLMKLLLGRVNGFAMEVDTALYLMNTNLSPKETATIMYHPQTLVLAPQCVIFPKKLKKSTRLVAAFNRGLQRLKDNGKYDQYLADSRQGLFFINK